MTTPSTFDQPWKRVLERCFRDFMELALPQAARVIDWDRGYETLDKELADLSKDGDSGDRVADLLVEVHPRHGDEAWVLVHLEVQMQPDRTLPQRMHTYSYRAYDRYAKRVASVAILGDQRRSHRPDSFAYELFGTELRLRFPVVKVLDFEARRAELEASRNPFSRVILTHLAALRTTRRPDARLTAKLALLRDLVDRG